MIGIDPDYDWMFDPQQAKPACHCLICGREIYAEGHDICQRCREDVDGDG